MAPASHPDLDLAAFRDQAHRYLVARFGDSYVFRAPETFDNVLERWIWAVAAGNVEYSEECIAKIEVLAVADKERKKE